MSELSPIKVIFFDINGEYKEDVNVDSEKNFLQLESPSRIIDQFLSDHCPQDLNKKTIDKYITQYEFSYIMKGKYTVKANSQIINNFSVSHHSIVDSNAYIVFCNLEKESTLELLKKIMDYINDNGSINVKTYIIGVFKENIDDDKTYSKMQNFLGDIGLDYEYYEMYLGEKDKYQMICKEYENTETMSNVFEKIFQNIYEGLGIKIQTNKVQKNNSDKSLVRCIIF